MKLVYKGKFSGDANDLPHGDHQPGAVKFKECEDSKKLGILANGIALILFFALEVVACLRVQSYTFSFIGAALSILTLFPHEFLHAICFREEVYLYTNLKEGMLFVVGPEIMTKARFIFMSLLPNLVFGVVPFALFLLNPAWEWLGTMGALAISMGAGDYYNVFNALTQMPRGAKTYLYQFNSWWFMPEKSEQDELAREKV